MLRRQCESALSLNSYQPLSCCLQCEMLASALQLWAILYPGDDPSQWNTQCSLNQVREREEEGGEEVQEAEEGGGEVVWR